MKQFFHTLLTMSATAAIAAIVVMILRLPLKKAPRHLTCLLWLVVLFRMVCPVSFESPVSIMPQAITTETYQTITLPESTPVIQAQTVVPDPVSPAAPGVTLAEPAAPTLTQVLLPIWAVGCMGMLLWVVLSYAKLRRRVADAVRIRDNIYETDRVDTPFVCGFVKPRIYLPVGLPEEDRTYVLLHEQAHIRRKDHLVKPLFCLALCAHWFNPVLWVAYWLLGKDIETACDQAVIRSFDRTDTAGYAAALLHLGRDRSLPQTVPLAFGEENPKKRVKHLLDYKHPGIWVAFVAVAVCILVGTILLADPGDRAGQYEGIALTQGEFIQENAVTPLPDDLRNDLVDILHDYEHSQYTDIDSVDIQNNTIKLTNANQGTIFYFHPETLTLVRVNHDGYSNIRKTATVDGAMAEDPDFIQWLEDLNYYVDISPADTLYDLMTPYVGDASAVGAILQHTPQLISYAGFYTMELQTSAEPYGITIHIDGVHPFEEDKNIVLYAMQSIGPLVLALVGNAETFTATYQSPLGDSWGITVDADPAYKNLSREAFRALYANCTSSLPTVSPWGYTAAETLYMSPDSSLYMGYPPETSVVAFTISKNTFQLESTNHLSSAWPEQTIFENPIYKQTGRSLDALTAPDGTTIDLTGYDDVEEVIVYDSNCQDTFYRLYRLNYDEETWVSHWTMTQQGMVMEYLLKVEPTCY